MDRLLAAAHEAIARCRSIAECTEEPGFTTRSFLSEPMQQVHGLLAGWMQHAGMDVCTDGVGNIRGCYKKGVKSDRRLFIGSHLDTVPRAGAYDGVLGVVLGVSLIQLLDHRPLNFAIEVIGFSEEEGLRFGSPFIGSRAFVGAIDDELLDRCDPKGISVRNAIHEFGLDTSRILEARAQQNALGYVEFHIEQGPVLEALGHRLAIVEAIVGQGRFLTTFTGKANHAGTTPMHLRHDALVGAAEWITAVEARSRRVPGLVATVGCVSVEPGAANVIPGSVAAPLDVRHAEDSIRTAEASALLNDAESISTRRGLSFRWEAHLDQPAAAMDPSLMQVLEQAVIEAGEPVNRMVSGAGHDAMIIAGYMPSAMLFIRSPGGVSHHASETVLVDDVAAALKVGLRFIEGIEARHE